MKKIIAVFVALAVGSTALFANPVSKSASQDKQSVSAEVKTEGLSSFKQDYSLQTVKAEAAGTLNQRSFDEADDLFADVKAAQLTQNEAQAVEGEGPFGAFFGGIAGAIIGGITGGWSGAASGAGIGIAIGSCLPW